LIQKTGNIPEDEMRKVFNLGVGLVIIASGRGVDRITDILREENEASFIVGEVVTNQNSIYNQTRKT
jgi:phosphoribosylformylglycinamidine cyclo-ligase